MENNMRPDELYHWGIKGQRWGVRRFQNSDGSLTAEGRKRYDADAPEKKSIRERIAARRAEKKAEAVKKKRVEAMKRGREEKKKREEEARQQEEASRKAAEQRAQDIKDGKVSFKDMTDEELSAHTARLRAEKQYKDAMKDVDPARRIASKMANEMIVPGVVDGGRFLTTALIKHYGSEWLGLNEKDAHTLLRERNEESRWRKEIIENDEWVKKHKDKNYLEKEKQKQAEQEEFDRISRESSITRMKSQIYKNRDYSDTAMDVFSEAEKAAINKSEEKAAKAAKEAAAKAEKAAQEAAAKDSDKKNKESSSKKQESKKETSKSTSEKLKETTSWFNSMDWDIKAHTPSKKTGRDADLYDQHLSRNEEEFLKKFMK